MKRKLLLFDIDETLVDGRTQKVPESAVKGIWEAHEKGHLIYINTGRCKSFIQASLKELPIDGYAYACGSHIEYKDQVLFEKFVPMEELIQIREAMVSTGVQGVLQGPETCYFGEEGIARLSSANQEQQGREKCYKNFSNFLKIYDRDYEGELKSFYEKSMRVNKLVTFWEKSSTHDEFLSRIDSHCQLIENGGGFTEILPLPYSKASCIDFLMDYFQIDMEECYVFGDSPNDLPMLNHVKNSIAMGNSYEAVKKAAKYVTTDIDQDGIYHALKHFGIIGGTE
jgi:hypothetical protein